jgi:cell shape-determining protein MreD
VCSRCSSSSLLTEYNSDHGEDSGSTEATIMMYKIIHIIMATALILQPAITEIAVDMNFSNSRLLPSIITSILWVICLMIVTEFRRRNAEK